MEATRLWTNFKVEWTADNSPTLRLKGFHPLDHGKPAESMHHSGGAATETLYIYGEAIRWVFENYPEKQVNVCSVGLGLGYNEILLAILVMSNSANSAKVDSFEIDLELKNSFHNWVFATEKIQRALSEKEIIHSDQIYDQIFEQLCSKLNVKVTLDEVKFFLQSQYRKNNWILKDELSLEKIPTAANYQLCLFDAFSQKTTHELWDELFLDRFFGASFDPNFCLLATYACTGVLTRALKNHGFTVDKKPGFQGKRDSTWALKSKK